MLCQTILLKTEKHTICCIYIHVIYWHKHNLFAPKSAGGQLAAWHAFSRPNSKTPSGRTETFLWHAICNKAA